MNRGHLEHLIRVAADIAEDDEIVILGSGRPRTGRGRASRPR
jgi:hypothetical protein